MMATTTQAKKQERGHRIKKEQPSRAQRASALPLPAEHGKVVAILLRSLVDVSVDVRKTLFMLHLRKKYTCVVYPDRQNIRGMLQKAKDCLTWGLLSEEAMQLLTSKRGSKLASDSTSYFHLSPPRGGFERRGIKNAFNDGGALGYRGDKINDLIKKMV